MYVARDRNTGLYYKRKVRYWQRQELTEDINEARIYKSVGGLKTSLNLHRRKYNESGELTGWELYFPDTIEIVPLEIQPKES